MNPNSPVWRNPIKRPTAWAGAAALTLSFLFGSSAASAAPPPANTVIGNQASAAYIDSSGAAQVATSNLVQTTVQQVGSFNLDTRTTDTNDIVNVKVGAAGSTVYAPHVLTNTGNAADNFKLSVAQDGTPFSKVEIYPDLNGDGLPDGTTPLCTSATGVPCDVASISVAGSNGTYPFVVAYTIPSTATTPLDPTAFGLAKVTATPVNTALYDAANQIAADKDQVNLTKNAAFSLAKTIGIPNVAAPGGGAWPTPATGGPRSTGASCATTWTAGLASSDTCQYTVYTLTFSNTGGAAGRLAISDTLPSGLTYVAGSAVWSNAGGQALNVAGASVKASGQTVNFVVDSINPNVTQTLSFVVLVNPSATIGATTTTNVAKYLPTDAGGSTTVDNMPPSLPSESNGSPYTVLASYGIVLGTGTGGATAVNARDTTAGTPNGTAFDKTTVASAAAGGTVAYPQVAFNTGNDVDTVNLTVAAGSFPAGTNFLFYAADGLTPLLDTDGDGVVDTGPIAAGASVNFVLKAVLPSNVAVGAGAFDAVVTGKSHGDASKIDATQDTLTAVTGALVDLTNSALGTGVGTVAGGDLGPGPSPLPTTIKPTTAGQPAVFALWVKNNDTVSRSYTLAASQSSSFPGSLPAGWTVKFVAAGAGCAATEITNLTVAAAGQTQVDACVTPAPNQAPVVEKLIYFQVKATTATASGVIASDIKTDAVTVNPAQTSSATLTPNNNGQVAPGGMVTYAHTLTNTGTLSCGAYDLAATLPDADKQAGWTASIYLDVNGDGVIDSGDTLVTGQIPGPLGAGQAQKILVRVFAPAGASAGAMDTVTVTATFSAGSNCGAPSATDISTVIAGQIRVVKTQAASDCTTLPADSAFAATPLSLKPGQCIVYKVVAINEGTAAISNLNIADVAPPYTSLTGAAQPTDSCVSSTGVTGTPLAYAVNGQSVSCGSTGNSVAPGANATLKFAVKIAN